MGGKGAQLGDNEGKRKGFSYFDFKGSLESTSEEPSKGANE